MEDGYSRQENEKCSGSSEYRFLEDELTYINPSTGAERKIPIIDMIQENGESYRLSWMNTTIRRYSQENDKQFNHIEIRMSNNEALCVRSDELLELLVEKKFPSSEVPWVEPNTRQWYEDLCSKLGIAAIEEFLQDN